MSVSPVGLSWPFETQWLFWAFMNLSDRHNNRIKAKTSTNLKACSNEANIVQHCWPNNVAQCWTKILSKFKLKPTSSNIIQHCVQTRPTCCTQQCWMMLDQHVNWLRLNRPLQTRALFRSVKRPQKTHENLGK